MPKGISTFQPMSTKLYISFIRIWMCIVYKLSIISIIPKNPPSQHFKPILYSQFYRGGLFIHLYIFIWNQTCVALAGCCYLCFDFHFDMLSCGFTNFDAMRIRDKKKYNTEKKALKLLFLYKSSQSNRKYIRNDKLIFVFFFFCSSKPKI